MTLPREGADSGERLLTVEAASELLSLGKSTLWAHVASGGVRSIHLGRGIRIHSTELARVMAEGLPERPRPGRRPRA